jgi:hypothetical protein
LKHKSEFTIKNKQFCDYASLKVTECDLLKVMMILEAVTGHKILKPVVIA